MSGAETALSPESGKRRARYLNDASLFSPLQNALRIFAENRIAFRMRDNHRNSAVAQPGERVGDLLRDAVVAEFDQQITGSVDDVTVRVGERVLNVVVGEVKIATEA